MKKKILTVIAVAVLLIIVFALIDYFTFGKFAVNEIRKEYHGEIIDIYSTRKNVAPTFLKIKTAEGNVDTSVRSDVINYSSIGDSIFKKKDKNIITVRKKTKEEKSFYLIQISEKLRKHSNFPDEWRNKWISPLKQ